MRRLLERGARWWFAHTLPSGVTTATIGEREGLRKARLLSVGALAAVLLACPLIINSARAQAYQLVIVLILFVAVHFAAVCCNRLGHVEVGSWVYLSGLDISAILALLWATPATGIEPLWGWAQLVIPSVAAGIFLPYWTPFVFGALNSLAFLLLIATAKSQQLYHTLPPALAVPYFSYVLVVMGAVAAISAVCAFTLKKAILEADQAAELASAHAALANAHADLADAYAQLEEFAATDAITGLLNHRALNARLVAATDHALSSGSPLAVIFTDLDHFKRINDTWGHQAGDQVLAHIATCLRQSTRSGDSVARYGGEEFVVLLPDHDRAQALQIAERIRSLIAATPLSLANGASIPVTLSMGVAIFPQDSPSIDEILIAADAAMYLAKNSGRNRVCSALDVAARKNAA